VLILTRKIEEAVTISGPDGREVVVRVLGFPSAGEVRLGFDAPPDFKILRDNAQRRTKRITRGEDEPYERSEEFLGKEKDR
jgi:carbon storage regulator CsrA